MSHHEISPWKKRLGVWGVGHTANFLMVQVFNLLIYPAVIWSFGLGWGAAVMWALSFLVCFATIKFYDWSKTDWLGIETLKEVRDAQQKGLLRNVLRWTLSKGDVLALIALSIKFDAFVCTVYMRRGAHNYNGMSSQDWKIFAVSIIISNLWWTIVVFSGLSVAEWVMKWVQSAF